MAYHLRTPGTATRLRLPALIRRYRWTIVYLLVWAPYIAIYQLVNRFPVRTPIELPFGALDRAIPFTPGLLPVYVLYLPFFFWTVARSEDDAAANRIFYGTYLQLLLSVPFFLLLPVTMPRHQFYGADVYGWADTFWRWFDEPNNCFPSLHTSNCLLFLHFNRRRAYRVASTLVGVMVIVSTVFVKQHYVVDVIGGAVVYLVARWFLAHAEIIGAERTPRSCRRRRARTTARSRPHASLQSGDQGIDLVAHRGVQPRRRRHAFEHRRGDRIRS